MRKTTRSITDGAITATLSVMLLLVDRLVAGFLMSFLPLPLIVYGIYYSIKETILAYVVTVLLVAIFPGQLSTTILMLMYGVIAVIYVGVSKTNLNKYLKFLFLFFGVTLCWIVMITGFGSLFGLSFELTKQEIITFLNITDANLINILAIGVIVVSMILETLIITLASEFITQRMKLHRKV